MLPPGLDRSVRVHLPAACLLAVVLGGCLGGAGSGGPPGEGIAARSGVHLDTSMLSSGGSTIHVLAEIRADTNLEYNFTNGRPDTVEEDAWSACGSVGIEVTGTDGEVWRDAMSWSESRGHAMVLAADGETTVVEHPYAEESLMLGLDRDKGVNTSARAGDVIHISLSAGEGPDTLFEPSVEVTTEGNHLVERSRWTSDFVCGSNLVDFEGTIASSGLPLAYITASTGATLEIPTEEGTRARFLVMPDPRFVTSCELGIYLEGTRVAHSGLQVNDRCDVSYLGGAGEVGFQVESLAGYGSIAAYFLWDEG